MKMNNTFKRLFLSIILVLGFGAVGTVSATVYKAIQERKNNFNEAISNLDQGYCDLALNNFELLERDNKWLGKFDKLLNKYDHLTDEAKLYQNQCSNWQNTVTKTDLARKNEEWELILINLSSFVQKHPGSKLVIFAKKQLGELFEEIDTALLTSDRSCQQVDSFLKYELIPEPERYLPLFYLGCIGVYQEQQDEQKEFNLRTKFLTAYPQHGEALRVKQGLLQSSLVCSSSENLQNHPAVSQWGNLMPVVYLFCGKAYQDVQDYKTAISYYQSVEIHFPKDELVEQADSYLDSVEQEINTIAREMSEAADVIKGRITACTAGSIFFDWLIDLGELISGKDCLTGESLHDLERWLTIIPLVDGFKGLSKLDRLWKIIDTVATFAEIQNTQNLLQNRQSLLGFLDNEGEMGLLKAHNSSIAPLVSRRGREVNLSKHYSEFVQLLE